MRTLRLAFTPRLVVYTLCILLTAGAVAHGSGVSAGVRYRGRSVGGVCVSDCSRHSRPYPNAPCGAAELSDLGPSAVSARRDAAGDAPVLFESEKDGTPFSRDKRAVVYQRAKMVLDKRPFGTQYDVYAEGFEWVRHSMVPRPLATAPFRVRIGGPDCPRPYDASILDGTNDPRFRDAWKMASADSFRPAV